MDWVEDSQAKQEILRAIAGEVRGTYPTRSGTLHVSELIYCLTRSWYNRVRPVAVTEKEAGLFIVGIGLEKVLLRPHKRSLSGEAEGIAFEIDFLYLDEYVGEFKTTRFSSNKGPDELPQTWQKQILSYMYAKSRYLKEPVDLEPRLAVFHLMGNYASSTPTLNAWRGKATLQEVVDNWDWMKDRKDILKHHLEIGVPPKQYTYNEDWECEECPYALFCQAAQTIDRLKGGQSL